MPARYERLDAHIVRLIWEGKLSYEEIDACGKEGRAYFMSINEMPTVLVIEMENAQIPFELSRMRQLLRIEEAENGSVGTVLVGRKPIIQLVAKVLVGVFRRNVAIVKTLEEGLEEARTIRDEYFSKHRK